MVATRAYMNGDCSAMMASWCLEERKTDKVASRKDVEVCEGVSYIGQLHFADNE